MKKIYDKSYETPSQPGVIGRSGLYFLDSRTTMDGLKYLELLQNKLEIYIHINGYRTFIHNDATGHKAKKVK